MAAYATLVSVMHIIEQIQHHPRPPISLYKNETQSLIEKVTFLQEFLEAYSHICNEQVDGLQSRIADAAYEAEDVIESHIVDQILAQSTTQGGKIGSALDFYLGLQKVIQDMNLIKKEVMEIQEKMGSVQDIKLHTSSSIPTVGSSGSHSKGQNVMVGFDDVLEEIMDKLTRRQSNRQIIPIVGMGGIGKTTLAINIYENPLIVQHFDIRGWATISREYSVKEILLELLRDQGNRERLSQRSEAELGHRLYQSLFGRRYLIIMDDLWSIKAWDKLKSFFPDNKNGSGIIITSRLSNLALQICGNCGLEMNFLNEYISWNLFCKIVFGVEDGCPVELEEVGREIARNCKGLPLSIVVIGGLLAKSEKTPECWGYIAKYLNSIVNLEDNGRCFKLLYTSYNHLPVHLKPCFLYMGLFCEDNEIHVSNLIKLWVAEGFLKPITGKSLEEVGEEYLKDLIDRNLILVFKWKFNGKIKFCKIHDLLRDLCLREAHKEKFLCVTKHYSSPERIKTQRRIAIHENSWEEENKYYLPQIHDALQSASLARSLICDVPGMLLPNCRLLRVFKGYTNEYSDTLPQRVNLRFLFVHSRPQSQGVDRWFSHIGHSRVQVIITGFDLDLSRSLPSVNLFWNLQTIILEEFAYTIEIWKIPLLRHVKLHRLCLPDTSSGLASYCSGVFDEQDDSVLGNLQTLLKVVNFKCSEKMVKMIPNIKKLEICYDFEFEGSRYCLNNLDRLHKLESLGCYFLSSTRKFWSEHHHEKLCFEFREQLISRSDPVHNITFPHNLKNLTLQGCNLIWEDISTKIGSLPLLQILVLKANSFIGPKWETIEGQFLSLKILFIQDCCDLECWITDSTHFPCLERLVLGCLCKLKEIPWGIGEIPTLQSIELTDCSDSANVSAKEIEAEQEQLGNETLEVQVEVNDEVFLALEKLDTQNIKVTETACTTQ